MKYLELIIEIGIFYSFVNVMLLVSNLIFDKDEKFSFDKKNYLYILAIIVLITIDYLVFHSFKNALNGIYLGLGISAVIFIIFFFIRIGFSAWFKFGINKFLYITDVNKSGFSLIKRTKTYSYSWIDFNDAVFDSAKQKIKLKGNKNFTIKKQMGSWYKILNNIPRTYQSLDYNYIDELFKDLKTCKVCGMIASNSKECLFCGSEVWNDKLKENYESEEKYIIENQLDEFATVEKTEKFNNFRLKDNFFKQDPNWQPIVTKEQVLEYSKKEYWEENEEN